jgi:hypothetical protein
MSEWLAPFIVGVWVGCLCQLALNLWLDYREWKRKEKAGD